MGYVENLRKLVGTMPLILVGAVVIILDEENKVLLQERTSPFKVWGLPGGLMELGESTEDTAKREVFEETGLEVEEITLLNIFSGEKYFTKIPNGDEFYSVTVVYYTNKFSGEVILNEDEGTELKFFSLDKLPDKMVRSHREFIEVLKEKMQNGIK